MGLESPFKAKLRKELKNLFPGCVILKNDANAQQGIPDMLVLYKDKWAMLEVKRRKPSASDYEPNQEWFIEKFDRMSFGACIYPENKEDVLHDLQQAFRPARNARASQC